jgi:hypothetical protein
MKWKKGQLWDLMIPWVIGIGILILMIILYMSMNESGTGAISYVKNLLRMG